MVTELQPARANKGNAVEFLAWEPFTSGRPVVVGGDLTDEALFRVANARKGKSIRIGPLSAETSARYSVTSPVDLRRLLKALVE
jgi:trehalose 6-phosphate phosphatase